MVKVPLVSMIALLSSGCCTTADRFGGEDLDRYVELCRETAMTPVEKEDPDDPMSKVDWMVGASVGKDGDQVYNIDVYNLEVIFS